jgi:hypothetical protein
VCRSPLSPARSSSKAKRKRRRARCSRPRAVTRGQRRTAAICAGERPSHSDSSRTRDRVARVDRAPPGRATPPDTLVPLGAPPRAPSARLRPRGGALTGAGSRSPCARSRTATPARRPLEARRRSASRLSRRPRRRRPRHRSQSRPASRSMRRRPSGTPRTERRTGACAHALLPSRAHPRGEP